MDRRYDRAADVAETNDDIRERLVAACTKAEEAGKRICALTVECTDVLVTPLQALVLAEGIKVHDEAAAATVAVNALGIDASFVFWMVQGLQLADVAPPARDRDAYNIGVAIAKRFISKGKA